eukprot:TRINITY_DN5902_c0_g1_i3.p1 TRINITY_DN5902_c0_g1~~TRINITY_DN5902_c0_g1_i3.p1  ORF type:complete len:198 (-),score=90.07 TRINITY_DN5902_c0_g1_i3:34-573(-)
MAQGEDSNIEEQGEAGVAELHVVPVPEIGKETPPASAVSELVTHADDILAVEVDDSLIGRALIETVDVVSGVELKEETGPTVPESVTQAPETVAEETVENLIEENVIKAVDSTSGIDMKEETLSVPLVSELDTKAEDTLVGETVENHITTDISLADESSGVEARADIGETDENNRQSTF